MTTQISTDATQRLSVMEQIAFDRGECNAVLPKPDHASSSWYHFLQVQCFDGEYCYTEIVNPRGEYGWREEISLGRDEAESLLAVRHG